MKQTATILACILLSVAATAQTTTNGALRQSSVVVTNEMDAISLTYVNTFTNRIIQSYSWGAHAGLYLSLGWQPAWTNIAGLPSAFPPEAHNQSYSTITDPPWPTTAQVPEAVFQNWITHSNLAGSVTITNQFEAPLALVGTGDMSISFSGLRIPYPVYVTMQGFDSLTFPAGTYQVGGGSWQTNRVNHFIIWQYSTSLYVNPVISTEL